MRNLQLRNMIITALLLGIGLVFHLVIPGIFLGMKPDLILAFMFIAFLINPKYGNAFLIGMLGGILSGMTSQVGFLPNFIEKIMTMNLIYILWLMITRVLLVFKINTRNFLMAPLLGLVGTLISGAIFITVAIFLGMFTFNEFVYLFTIAVIPACIGNVVITALLYHAINLAMKRSHFMIKTA